MGLICSYTPSPNQVLCRKKIHIQNQELKLASFSWTMMGLFPLLFLVMTISAAPPCAEVNNIIATTHILHILQRHCLLDKPARLIIRLLFGYASHAVFVKLN